MAQAPPNPAQNPDELLSQLAGSEIDRLLAEGETSPAGLILTEPFGYLDFLSLLTDARAVLTDSGGIQEETTYLGIPCFTLRANTERPVTVELGTNTLLGLDPAAIAEIPATLATHPTAPSEPPPLWDGHAAERIADILAPPDPELLSA